MSNINRDAEMASADMGINSIEEAMEANPRSNNHSSTDVLSTATRAYQQGKITKFQFIAVIDAIDEETHHTKNYAKQLIIPGIISIEKGKISQPIMEVNKTNDRNQSNDPLANYSARDLITATHWTSKSDLDGALEDPRELNIRWDDLVEADRRLHRFYDFELARIIEKNHRLKQHNS